MNYAKVYRKLWIDENFRALPEDSRQLWQYLLTCPYGNSLGYFILDDGAAAGDLQWSTRRLKKALQPLIVAKMVTKDDKNRLVFLRNALKFNQPDNQNVLKAWNKLLDSLPKSPLFTEFKQVAIKHLDAKWAREWVEGLANPFDTVLPTVPPTVSKQYGKSSSPEPRAQSPNKEQRTTTPTPSSPDEKVVVDVFTLYEQNIAPLTPLGYETLKDAVQEFGEEKVREAIKIAALHNKKNWAYIEGILKNMQNGRGKNDSDPDKYVKQKHGTLVIRSKEDFEDLMEHREALKERSPPVN